VTLTVSGPSVARQLRNRLLGQKFGHPAPRVPSGVASPKNFWGIFLSSSEQRSFLLDNASQSTK